MFCPQDTPFTCTGTYTIKQDDMDAGYRNSTSFVSSVSPNETDVLDTANYTARLLATAGISIGEWLITLTGLVCLIFSLPEYSYRNLNGTLNHRNNFSFQWKSASSTSHGILEPSVNWVMKPLWSESSFRVVSVVVVKHVSSTYFNLYSSMTWLGCNYTLQIDRLPDRNTFGPLSIPAYNQTTSMYHFRHLYTPTECRARFSATLLLIIKPAGFQHPPSSCYRHTYTYTSPSRPHTVFFASLPTHGLH